MDETIVIILVGAIAVIGITIVSLYLKTYPEEKELYQNKNENS